MSVEKMDLLGGIMKSILVSFGFIMCAAFAIHATTAETKLYGVHLFFNETEFVDTLTLTTDVDGTLSGHMYVPDDFEGDIINVVRTNNEITFDLLVPKNRARTEDMTFHYVMTFFNEELKQATGFVTLKDRPEFVASLVAFLR